MRNGMHINAGDKIGLVATARWVDQETINDAMRVIQAWGCKPVPGNALTARWHQFAGTDRERANDLQHMMDNPDIRAILCMRGGYGTIRILDMLDFTAFMEQPKYLCGFSDVTALHAHINDKLGLPTLHCAMPFTFHHNTDAAIHSIRNALMQTAEPVQAPAHPLNIQGSATGILIGGNLSILYALLGTRYGFSTAGKILFIEDLDEFIYHIDRMCMSMKLAGKFDHIAGLVVGGLTDMHDNAQPFGSSAEDVIRSYAEQLGVPVAFGMPAGHLDDNRALVLGAEVRLEVNPSGSSLHW